MVSALVGNVETGSRTVDDAGASMSRIVEEANHVSEPTPEITRAPTEQSVGVTQINAHNRMQPCRADGRRGGKPQIAG